MSSVFATKIEFLKGVGSQRAQILQKDLAIFTYADLLQHYPYRYEDRTIFHKIATVNEQQPFVQLKGTIKHIKTEGMGAKKRLMAVFSDGTGQIDLLWFRGIAGIQKFLKTNIEYVVFGKPTWFYRQFSLAHPEIDVLTVGAEKAGVLQPVYHTSEKMKNFGLDSKGISKLMRELLPLVLPVTEETLPENLLQSATLIPKQKALKAIHFPSSFAELQQAQYRLKFEELFYNQLKIIRLKTAVKQANKGLVCVHLPKVNEFYKHYLPFELTGAQKRVIREIYDDLKSGRQMNRLLQGDVGSGKTMVAFIAMLMCADNYAQAALMAPTEILAEQHFFTLKKWADKVGITIALLTGSTKTAERKRIDEGLQNGNIQLLVGTHALIEDAVTFKNLGMCVIDEQHRFGVAQRARLWQKNKNIPPHILVMTATPIPRTLAMTFYGDLDVSVIDELPIGRKPIKTVHRLENQRLAVYGFMKQEIAKGRQIYVVYPLIEESEKMDLANLYQGYEEVLANFPRPQYQVCMVHGRMNAAEKEAEMKRFVKNEAQIMVATTVIEVGVNVPNASVMLIENAERFGLAQLHQLRGRVGRGAEQSYCILMTGSKLTTESREKIRTLVATQNGFEIAEADLKLRGPGDLMGTKQSGVLDLMIADLSQDQAILKLARETAQNIIESDFELKNPAHLPIKKHIDKLQKNTVNWAKIS